MVIAHGCRSVENRVLLIVLKSEQRRTIASKFVFRTLPNTFNKRAGEPPRKWGSGVIVFVHLDALNRPPEVSTRTGARAIHPDINLKAGFWHCETAQKFGVPQ